MLLCWVAVLLMLVAVAARGLGLVFRGAGVCSHVAGLGARVAKDLSDRCCAWAWIGFRYSLVVSLCWALVFPKISLSGAVRGLGLIFRAAGLGRCGVDGRGGCSARAWFSFLCCWAWCPCRWAGYQRYFGVLLLCVGLDWFSVLLGWLSVSLCWGLVLPTIFLFGAARALALVFHVAGLARCAVDGRGCCNACAWFSFVCCWAGCPCRWAGRSCCQRSFYLLMRVGFDWRSVLLGWLSVSLCWALVLPKIFLSGARVGLDGFSMVVSWVAMVVMLVAVAARGIG